MKYNSKTITLTTEAKDSMKETEVKAKSIQILLGSYNLYGRHIPLDEYKKIQSQFDALLGHMEYLYEKYS